MGTDWPWRGLLRDPMPGSIGRDGLGRVGRPGAVSRVARRCVPSGPDDPRVDNPDKRDAVAMARGCGWLELLGEAGWAQFAGVALIAGLPHFLRCGHVGFLGVLCVGPSIITVAQLAWHVGL